VISIAWTNSSTRTKTLYSTTLGTRKDCEKGWGWNFPFNFRNLFYSISQLVIKGDCFICQG